MALDTATSRLVGDNVRAELARRKHTQSDLAVRLSLPQPAVSRRIRGLTAWTVDELVAVAAWLDIDVTALLVDAA